MGFSSSRSLGALRFLLAAVALAPTVLARDTVYINGTGSDGVTRKLDVSRYPALYTGDFADCMNGESLFNVTRFDTAYYRDNLTVLFHLDGSTNIRKESVMLHIEVDVYGENRFNTTYEPCAGDISSMCPVKAGVPITAYAALNLTSDEDQGLPGMALGIPDLEGFARLRIFANSTQTQIGCFQAVLTNGQTFSQPQIVGSIVGGFVCLAILASFATAIYGIQIPHMRMHYAHSFSLLVIFETFQSIFFLGALSVDWPGILPAWWSNFAWTAGMFASDSMLSSLASFTGISGNASQVGGAGSVPINNGGGLSQQIYGQSLASTKRSTFDLATRLNSFSRRDDYNASDPYDYNWAGKPRDPGMPLPGDYSGFAGTLSIVNIPQRDAFIIGFIWLLVALGAVVLFVTAVKLVLDLFRKSKLLKTDGFDYFRSHWLSYVTLGILRTLFIAFFAMMTLALFQFSLQGPAGPTAIAAIVFVIFLGLASIVYYACCVRLREGKYEVGPDMLRLESGRLFKTIPFVAATRDSKIGEEEQAQKPRLFGTIPFFRIKFTANDPNRPSTNQDTAYIKRFGWLSARYRHTRWWFFAAYLGYQFVRACFIGAASQNPMAQVYGLFVFEIFALAAIIKLKPFEGARNTAVATWMLSIVKIITTGLSIAFLPSFGISRTAAVIIGLVVLVIQAFLGLVVLVLVMLGIFSTWMSLSRNREHFLRPLDNVRIHYFEHLEARTGDMPPRPTTPEQEGTFKVKEVRRHPKIEDTEQFPSLPGSEDIAMHPINPVNQRSRANSASSRMSVSSLPRTGRAHRASWSSKELAEWDAEMNRGDQARSNSIRSRSNSLRKQAANLQGFQPMTPARESAEFPRWPENAAMLLEESSEDKTEEAAETTRRKRIVSFADDQPASSGSNTSNTSTKVEDAVPEKIDEEKTRTKEAMQEQDENAPAEKGDTEEARLKTDGSDQEESEAPKPKSEHH